MDCVRWAEPPLFPVETPNWATPSLSHMFLQGNHSSIEGGPWVSPAPGRSRHLAPASTSSWEPADADADAESQQVLELNCFSFKVSDQQEVGGKWRHLAEGGSSIQAPPTDGAWALTKIPRTLNPWFVGKFTHIILVGDSTCTCVCCWSGRGVAGRYGWNANSNRHPVTPRSPLASTFTSRPTR